MGCKLNSMHLDLEPLTDGADKLCELGQVTEIFIFSFIPYAMGIPIPHEMGIMPFPGSGVDVARELAIFSSTM